MGIVVINQEKKQINNFLRNFVQEVMKKAELVEADGSFDEPYVDNLVEELQKAIGIMVMDALPAEAFEAYAKMIYEEKSKPQELGAFLESKIADFAAKRQKVLEDFAVRILETANVMKAALA